MIMTQEYKELLLRELCSRLPYGLMLNIDYYDLQGDEKLKNRDAVLSHGNIGHCFGHTNWVSVKPYLRPISSMTEEECKEYSKLWNLQDEFPTDADIRFKIDVFDYLNAHHFDYRGLIVRGLAIEVTEENNPYKE